MRHVEAGIYVVNQRVRLIHHPVREHAPDFFRLRHAMLTIAKLQQRMGRQAGAQGRGDVVDGPADHTLERFPEGLRGQLGSDHIGTGDDQRIQSLLLDFLHRLVVLIDVGLRRGAAFQFRQGKRVHVELRYRVALADQSEKLPLCSRQRRVGHHVQQTDMQFANILL